MKKAQQDSSPPITNSQGGIVDVERLFFKMFAVLASAPTEVHEGLVSNITRRVHQVSLAADSGPRRSLAEEIVVETFNVLWGTLGVGE